MPLAKEMTDTAKLTDRELDAAIAEKVMGWTCLPASGKQKVGKTTIWELSFTPSTDRNAAALVLERIEALGKCNDLVFERPLLVDWDWFLLTLSPRQLCEAALRAVEKEEK